MLPRASPRAHPPLAGGTPLPLTSAAASFVLSPPSGHGPRWAPALGPRPWPSAVPPLPPSLASCLPSSNHPRGASTGLPGHRDALPVPPPSPAVPLTQEGPSAQLVCRMNHTTRPCGCGAGQGPAGGLRGFWEARSGTGFCALLPVPVSAPLSPPSPSALAPTQHLCCPRGLSHPPAPQDQGILPAKRGKGAELAPT